MSNNSLNSLNPQQREAALHKDGPLLILAGAGSGKTSTMTHRIAHLIKDEGVSPYEMLAVTFTNKAAAEMRDRVENLIGGGVRMWILTFHSACLRILRAHADRLGYGDGFAVYDPTDQKVVVKAAVKQLNLDEKKFTPAYVLEVVGKAKETGKTAAIFAEETDQSPLRKALAAIYAEYEKTLKKNNAMDFDDLLMNTVFLLDRNPDILEKYQQRFHYIMVDEYQDTNYMQYRFVKMLAERHGNICVVGDDDQCIYQWRGADISNILDFEKDFKGTKVIKLEQNYRSDGNILGAANSVIAHNQSRKRKRLWTDRKEGEKLRYVCTYDEKEEARFTAREIAGAVDEGRNYREFAILYRTNAQSRTFEEAFSAYHIPYQIVGGVRYYDRKEIKDILSYMRLVQNPADDIALARIINEPKRGIGEKTVAKLTALAVSEGESVFRLLHDEYVLGELSANARNSAREMIAVLDAYIEERENIRVSTLYDGLLVKTGYLRALEQLNNVEADGRIENLLEFKSVISDYEIEDPNISLAEFLEKITLISDIDNHDRGENAVTMMTMHSAKGLEFPVVFIPGMEEGLFPGARSLESLGGVEEERRLCYVGITRAMERLYLLRAEARTIYGRYGSTIESRFLREIDKQFIEGAEQLGKDTTRYLHAPMGADDGYAEAEVIRPFDQLRRIKENALRVTPISGITGAGDTDFASGDRVRHIKFGDGLVIDADEKTVTVMFDKDGKKKLAKGLAPLRRL